MYDKKLNDEISQTAEDIAKLFKVNPELHTEDMILRYLFDVNHASGKALHDSKKKAIEFYFKDGSNSAHMLAQLLKDICGYDGKKKIKLLEFASGFGCVTRHLLNAIPFCQTTACDIHPKAVKFTEETLGCNSLLSTTSPENLKFDDEFDVTFALSFFSHMPKYTFSKWVGKLMSSVKQGGYLIFTTHGIQSSSLIPQGKEFDEEGFLFDPQSDQGDLDLSDYGTTFTLANYVLSSSQKKTGCILKYYEQGYWWGHQDVYVFQKAVNEEAHLEAILCMIKNKEKKYGELHKKLQKKELKIEELYKLIKEKDCNIKGVIDVCYINKENELNIVGWAADLNPHRTIKEVQIIINGNIVQNCQPGNKRQDVADYFNTDKILNSGWSCFCDLTGIMPEDTITVKALNTEGEELIIANDKVKIFYESSKRI